MNYTELFKNTKPVIAMLHLKGLTAQAVLENAKRETDIYMENGVDAVLVENYFGSADDCEAVLSWLRKERAGLVYGVNILGDYHRAFELAAKYEARFIQIDSVSGHLTPKADTAFAEDLAAARAVADVVLLGGVRFKYQPVLSGRTLAEDLRLGMERCDAIVVTGEGTGQNTPLEKVKDFRAVVGNFPLVVGAGVMPETADDTFAYADGMIVGSYFKKEHRAAGDVCAEYVREITLHK